MTTASGHVKPGMGAMRPLTLRHFIGWLIELLEHNPMSQLRRMRDLERRVRSLVAGRDELIRHASQMGYSRRHVAAASGISPSQVQRIIRGEES